MLQFIYGVILWLVVPCIMLSMLILSMQVCAHADEKRSAWAGFFLGLIFFVIYVISTLSKLQGVYFTSSSFPDFNSGAWMILVLGAIIGFFLLTAVAFLKPTRGIGIVTVFLYSC